MDITHRTEIPVQYFFKSASVLRQWGIAECTESGGRVITPLLAFENNILYINAIVKSNEDNNFLNNLLGKNTIMYARKDRSYLGIWVIKNSESIDGEAYWIAVGN